ncbi:hypothetical protein ACLOJK_030731 [Asimina triloba]
MVSANLYGVTSPSRGSDFTGPLGIGFEVRSRVDWDGLYRSMTRHQEKNFFLVENHFKLPSLKKSIIALNATSCPFYTDVVIQGFSRSACYVVGTPHSLLPPCGLTILVKKNHDFQSFTKYGRLLTILELRQSAPQIVSLSRGDSVILADRCQIGSEDPTLSIHH